MYTRTNIQLKTIWKNTERKILLSWKILRVEKTCFLEEKHKI